MLLRLNGDFPDSTGLRERFHSVGAEHRLLSAGGQNRGARVRWLALRDRTRGLARYRRGRDRVGTRRVQSAFPKPVAVEIPDSGRRVRLGFREMSSSCLALVQVPL